MAIPAIHIQSAAGKTQARPYFIQASHKKNQIGKAVTT